MVRSRRNLFVAIVAVAVLLGVASLLLRLTTVSRVDVGGVSDVSCGYGILRLRQGSPASLVVKADAGMRPHLMARKTGTLLELGLADDADPRVLLYSFGLMRPPKNGRVEWILTLPEVNRLGVYDRSTVYADGIRTDTLRVNAGGHGKGYLTGLDVKTLYVEISYGDPCRIVTEGFAETQSVLSGGGDTYDGSKLKYRFSEPYDPAMQGEQGR